MMKIDDLWLAFILAYDKFSKNSFKISSLNKIARTNTFFYQKSEFSNKSFDFLLQPQKLKSFKAHTLNKLLCVTVCIKLNSMLNSIDLPKIQQHYQQSLTYNNVYLILEALKMTSNRRLSVSLCRASLRAQCHRKFS